MSSSHQDPWYALHEELDHWKALERTATLWWRDDDTTKPGPKLERLQSICANTGLLLAVVPQSCDPALYAFCADTPSVRIAQHGYAHINHAPRGQGLGAWELGLHREKAAVLSELEEGRQRLVDAYAELFLPVVVPPWNRIDPALFAALQASGYKAVSAFGTRSAMNLVDNLLSVNSHVDPIRWKTGARFAGTEKTINSLVEHLKNRRLGISDSSEITGYLTHHIDLDEEGWDFSEQLARYIEEHPGSAWVYPADIF